MTTYVRGTGAQVYKEKVENAQRELDSTREDLATSPKIVKNLSKGLDNMYNGDAPTP